MSAAGASLKLAGEIEKLRALVASLEARAVADGRIPDPNRPKLTLIRGGKAADDAAQIAELVSPMGDIPNERPEDLIAVCAHCLAEKGVVATAGAEDLGGAYWDPEAFPYDKSASPGDSRWRPGPDWPPSFRELDEAGDA